MNCVWKLNGLEAAAAGTLPSAREASIEVMLLGLRMVGWVLGLRRPLLREDGNRWSISFQFPEALLSRDGGRSRSKISSSSSAGGGSTKTGGLGDGGRE